MCQMKLLLKMRRSRGHHFRNTKLTKYFFSLVKVYLGIHNITNNPSKENGICIKSLLIFKKEVNITVLNGIVMMVGKLLEESF